MDQDRRTEGPIEVADDLNRLLEVGKLLFSVLPPEEIESLQILFSQKDIKGEMVLPYDVELGNTSVT